ISRRCRCASRTAGSWLRDRSSDGSGFSRCSPATTKLPIDQQRRRETVSGQYGKWSVAAGAALTLSLLVTSALAQQTPNPPPAPPRARAPMPGTGHPVAAPAPLAPVLASYKPVTADRLKQPDDGDWLMFRRTYNGWGYSPLNQITTANASHLHPVWSMATG